MNTKLTKMINKRAKLETELFWINDEINKITNACKHLNLIEDCKTYKKCKDCGKLFYVCPSCGTTIEK